MSAWLVSKAHIDLIVCGAIEGPWRHDTRSPLVNTSARDKRVTWKAGETAQGWPKWANASPYGNGFVDFDEEIGADGVGRMLWLENLRSVSYRYPDDTGNGDRPGPVGLVDADVAEYTYTDPGYRPTVGELKSALDCWEYQSCEHPDFRSSPAAAFHDAMQEWLLDAALQQLGQTDTPWGWDADTIAQRRLKLGPVPVRIA